MNKHITKFGEEIHMPILGEHGCIMFAIIPSFDHDAQREKVPFSVLEIHSGLLHIVKRALRLTIWSSPECISMM